MHCTAELDQLVIRIADRQARSVISPLFFAKPKNAEKVAYDISTWLY
jgi:hypothetical protein